MKMPFYFESHKVMSIGKVFVRQVGKSSKNRPEEKHANFRTLQICDTKAWLFLVKQLRKNNYYHHQIYKSFACLQ